MISTKPIVCKLSTPELQHRKATAIAALRSRVLLRTELENGFIYEFTASDEVLDQLNEFVKTERICCDFLTFHLTIHDTRAFLNIIGPVGAKEFLQEEVGL